MANYLNIKIILEKKNKLKKGKRWVSDYKETQTFNKFLSESEAVKEIETLKEILNTSYKKYKKGKDDPDFSLDIYCIGFGAKQHFRIGLFPYYQFIKLSQQRNQEKYDNSDFLINDFNDLWETFNISLIKAFENEREKSKGFI